MSDSIHVDRDPVHATWGTAAFTPLRHRVIGHVYRLLGSAQLTSKAFSTNWRGKGIGSSGLKCPQGFTTENHGEPRRFLRSRWRASAQALESKQRRWKHLLKYNPSHTAPRRLITQSVRGPFSPCASVILRFLRGKTLRCRSKSPAVPVWLFGACPHLNSLWRQA